MQSLIEREDVEEIVAEIAAPFPLDRPNFSNVQLVSSLAALLREIRDVLNATDAIAGVVS